MTYGEYGSSFRVFVNAMAAISPRTITPERLCSGPGHRSILNVRVQISFRALSSTKWKSSCPRSSRSMSSSPSASRTPGSPNRDSPFRTPSR